MKCLLVMLGFLAWLMIVYAIALGSVNILNAVIAAGGFSLFWGAVIGRLIENTHR